MGNSFVLFDVSIVISHGQFQCGNRGYTQNADFPWVKSHFPVGKRSSGTTAIINSDQVIKTVFTYQKPFLSQVTELLLWLQGRTQDFKRGGGWQTIFIEGW